MRYSMRYTNSLFIFEGVLVVDPFPSCLFASLPPSLPQSFLVPGNAGPGVVGERPPDAIRSLDALQELPLRIRTGTTCCTHTDFTGGDFTLTAISLFLTCISRTSTFEAYFFFEVCRCKGAFSRFFLLFLSARIPRTISCIYCMYSKVHRSMHSRKFYSKYDITGLLLVRLAPRGIILLSLADLPLFCVRPLFLEGLFTLGYLHVRLQNMHFMVQHVCYCYYC